MCINQRIKELRKDLGLNQKEFGSKLEMSQGAVSWMEQDGNTVVDQNKRIICDQFGVSLHWLETGEGDMYTDSDERLFERLHTELGLNEREQQILRTFLTFSEEERTRVLDFATEFVARLAAERTAEETPPDSIPMTDDEIQRELDSYEAELRAQKKAPPASDGGSATKKQA